MLIGGSHLESSSIPMIHSFGSHKSRSFYVKFNRIKSLIQYIIIITYLILLQQQTFGAHLEILSFIIYYYYNNLFFLSIFHLIFFFYLCANMCTLKPYFIVLLK